MKSQCFRVISVYYQNVRSVRSKVNNLYCFLTNLEYDFICLTETWLDPSVSSSELIPKSYSVYRKDRNFEATGRSRGGGVLLALHEKFNATGIDLSHICFPDLIDVVGCTLCYYVF